MSDELEEFWQLFKEESEDALNNSEDCLVNLEDDRENKDQINTLFRAIHTFKGSSRMMGLTGIESIAHVFEDIVGLVRDKDVPLDDDMFGLLLKTIDALRTLLEKVLETKENQPIDDYQDVYDELKSTYAQHSGQPVEENTAAAEETVNEAPIEEKPENESPQEKAEDNAAELDNFTKVFIEISDKEIALIESLLKETDSLDDETKEKIKKAIDNIAYAAENMKYDCIVNILKELDSSADSGDHGQISEKWNTLGESLKEKINLLRSGGSLEDNVSEETTVTDTKEEEQQPESTESGFTPNQNPNFVKVFLEIVDNEVAQLKAITKEIKDLDDKTITDIKKVIDNLMHAAENMGYNNIMYNLERLHAELIKKDSDNFITQWTEIEKKLEESIDEIRDDGKEKIALDDDEIEKERELEGHDPQTDPQYVKIFFELADSELINLRRALDDFFEKKCPKEDVLKITQRLNHAATSMKYDRIVDKIKDVEELFKSTDNLDTNKVGAAELALREEISAIFNVVDIKETREFQDEALHSNEASSVFVQTYTKQAQDNINKLNSGLEKIVVAFQKIKNGEQQEFDNKLVVNIIKYLKNIYHTSIFYSLNSTAQMALTLEDLYSRVHQGEITLSDKIIEATENFKECIIRLFAKIENKEKADEEEILGLIKNIKSEVFVSADNQLSIITNQVLNMLDIDQSFMELLTPENIVDISEHLHNGSSFYTLLADLESNEEIGVQVYELFQKESIQAISNITVYENDRTSFLFLLASILDEDQLRESLATVDPEYKYLKLSPCQFHQSDNEGNDVAPIEDFFEDFTLEEAPLNSESQRDYDIEEAQGHEDVDINDIDLIESVGQLVIAHSALSHVVEEINQNDLPHQLSENIKQNKEKNDDGINTKEILNLAEAWSEDIKGKLGQIMRDFASSLDFLKDLSIKLRNVSITTLIDPLQYLVRDTSYHFDRKVDLQILGNETSLDKDIVDRLMQPLKDCIWFTIIHSIEPGETRKEKRKPHFGTIQFKIENLDDKIQFVLEDDGQGFSEEALKEIAHKNRIPLKEIDSLYDVISHSRSEEIALCSDKKGVNFKAIREELEKKQGEFNILPSNLGGNQFIFTMPLSAIVIDGMVVKVENVCYIIPIKAIKRILKPEDNMVNHFSTDGGESYIKLGEDIITINTLNKNNFAKKADPSSMVYVIVEFENNICAFDIDELIGQQQVLVHPLQGFLSDVPSISGCAVLAGGNIGMVLDVSKIIRTEKRK